MKYLVLFALVAMAAAASQPFFGAGNPFGGFPMNFPQMQAIREMLQNMDLSNMDLSSLLNFPVPAGKSGLNAKVSRDEFHKILSDLKQYPELQELLSVYEQLNMSDEELQQVLDMLPGLGYPVAKYYDPMSGMYYPDTTTLPSNLPAQFQIFQYFGKREPTTTPYWTTWAPAT